MIVGYIPVCYDTMKRVFRPYNTLSSEQLRPQASRLHDWKFRSEDINIENKEIGNVKVIKRYKEIVRIESERRAQEPEADWKRFELWLNELLVLWMGLARLQQVWYLSIK